MKIWPTIKLDSLSKELDLFDRKAEPDPELVRSGLYPPLPVSGSYLIHGFSLLEKAKKLGIKELFTIEFPAMEKQDLLELCLKCEARTGDYGWPEMERMVDFLENEKAVGEKLVRLILGHDDPLFYKQVKEYSGFSPCLKQLAGNKILDFKTARGVRELPDAVFSSILYYKENNNFTFSQVRLFLSFLDGIARRDHLQESDIIRICDELLSQKKPLEAVKKIRFTELSGLYERLNNIKHEILKGTGIQLDAPPFFEGDSFEVRFCFQSKKQLQKRIKVLERLKERTDELFGLL